MFALNVSRETLGCWEGFGSSLTSLLNIPGRSFFASLCVSALHEGSETKGIEPGEAESMRTEQN